MTGRRARYLGACVAGLLLAWSSVAVAACPDRFARRDLLEVRAAARVTINVCPERVVRDVLPPTLFGFNVQRYGFERDIWDAESGTVPDTVLDSLRLFPGALYRFPGGLVSNRFDWEASVGPLDARPARKAVRWDEPAPVRFGVDEYLGLVREAGGQPWYVLNLNGWHPEELFHELDIDTIAASNRRLAEHMRAKLPAGMPRYYQLGNELDRADYQWSHEKYIARSRASIDAMKQADPDANFVAFLREFDWEYRGKEAARGKSRFPDFIRDVLTALPEVDDFSMHFYYDARNGDKAWQAIPWRLRQFRKAIDVARDVREGKSPNVWITEHARGIVFGEDKAVDVEPFTSNLSAAISTADFLIALAQFPEVQGASWHGLNAMPWRLFDPANGLRPNPVFDGLRVLRQTPSHRAVATWTSSTNRSSYAGGYDIRAAAFLNAEGTELSVWVANRAEGASSAALQVEGWKGRAVDVRHYFLRGRAGVSPDEPQAAPLREFDPEPVQRSFGPDGALMLSIPPASVSNFVLRVR